MGGNKQRYLGRAGRRLLAAACLLLLCLAGCGRSYEVDETLGLGTAEGTEKEDGVVYAATDRNCAVVFELPNRQEVDLTAFGQAYDTVYLADSALDRAKKLTTLALGDNVAYDPALREQLAALPGLSYPEDSATTAWAMLLDQVDQINAVRAERGVEEQIEPSLPVCQAAQVRVEELQEQYEVRSRPDGRGSISVLSDADIPCAYLLTCIGTGETLEELETDVAENSSSAYGTYDNIVFSRLGLAVKKGTFEGKEQYGYTYFFVLPELTGVTVDGVTYEKTDDGLRITGCTEEARQIYVPNEIAGKTVTDIAPGAFQNHPQLLSVSFSTLPMLKNMLTAELFAGCDSLRAVTLPSYLDCSAVVLPEGGQIFDYLMPMVDRQRYTHLAYLYVEDGAVYGLVQRLPEYPAVLMSVPPDAESFTVPEEVDGHRVAYIHQDALRQAPNLRELTVPDACAVEPGLLTELIESENIVLYMGTGSMTDAMRWSIELAEDINAIRAESGLDSITPALTMVQMAWGRAKDMNEVTDEQRAAHQRPDGGNWIDIIADPDIPYTVSGQYNHYVLSEDYQGVRSEDQIERLVLSQFSEEYAARTLGDEILVDQVGMGVYYGEYQGEPAIFCVCISGYLVEEYEES